MGSVIHFEIHASDPVKVINFYTHVFGWKFTQWQKQKYWIIDTKKSADDVGINGGLLPRQGHSADDGQPVNSFICTIQIKDMDETLRKVREAAGRQVVDTRLMKGLGKLAYCKDNDGNIFGLLEPIKNT